MASHDNNPRKRALDLPDIRSSDLELTPSKMPARSFKNKRTASSSSVRKTPPTVSRLGLPPSVAKKIQKHVSEFPNFIDVAFALNAETLQRQTLLTEEECAVALLNYYKNIPDKRNYSTLTEEDFDAMLNANGIRFTGMISYNEDILLKDNKIRDSFWDQYDILQEFNVRTTEQGCRSVISLFFLNAIHAAKRKISNKKFQEVSISHPNLPGIGPISGPVHLMSASLPRDIPLKVTDVIAKPTKPIFILVEAKKTKTLSEISSNAQLTAQLLTTLYDDKFSHAGILTDGRSWQFYLMERLMTEEDVEEPVDVDEIDEKPVSVDLDNEAVVNLSATGSILITDKKSASIVFALLTYFTGGYVPEKKSK